MTDKKLLTCIILLFSLVILPCVVAGNFYAHSTTDSITACECAVIQSEITIVNTDSIPLTMDLDLEGSAAKFAGTSPDLFILDAGKSKIVSLIISAPCDSKGDYDLDVIINGDDRAEVLNYEIKVGDCSNLYITQKDSATKTVEACKPASYAFNLKNIGSFSETYSFDVEGIDSSWVSYTESASSLVSTQDRDLFMFVMAPCEAYGTFDFNLVVEGEKSNTVSEIPLYLNILPAYDFAVEFESNEYTICNGETGDIPFIFTNHADFSNEYKIELTGPSWVSVDHSQFILPKRSYDTIFLTLSPHRLDDGVFDVNLKITELTGNTELERNLKINVDVCNMFEVEVLEYDYACSGEELVFPFTVKNVGTKSNTVLLQPWGDFEASIINEIAVSANSKEDVNLSIIIPTNFTGSGVTGVSAFLYGAEFADRIWFDVVNTPACYLVDIDIEDDALITNNDVREIPIIITNAGARGSDYYISIDQDYDWIIPNKENPIYIGEQETRIINLLAFPENVDEGEYELTVTASTNGISYSKTVTVEITDDVYTKNDSNRFVWLTSIGEFFKSYLAYIIAGVVILIVLIGLMHFLGEDKWFNKKDEEETVIEEKVTKTKATKKASKKKPKPKGFKKK